MAYSQVENLLINRYKQCFDYEGAPSWSVRSKKDDSPVNPTIPFVGRNYHKSRLKIAVYASSENLTNYEEGKGPAIQPELLETDISWNRHRISYETIKSEYFPYVHIQPVTDGGLYCAASFVWSRLLNEPFDGTPADLLEGLVVANVGKYSLASYGSGKVIDYAGSPDRMRPSLPYFKIDMEYLKPDVLIIPMTIYKHPELKQYTDSYIDMKVIPVYQCNAKIVNIHLKKYDVRAMQLASDISCRNPLLAEWTNNIKRISSEKFYRYYAHIEEAGTLQIYSNTLTSE